MPRKVFVAGEILTASDVNTNLMDQSVMVFDDATARATAIPTPVEGMVTYLSDEDEVQVFDGSAFKAVGPGKILQVVSTTKTDTYSEAITTGVSTNNVTGLTATITPISTGSKVLITVSGHFSSTGADGFGGFIIRRGATTIGVGDAANNRSRVTSYGGAFTNEGNDMANLSVTVLDSPATTSSTTYAIRLHARTSGTFFVNRTKTDTDVADIGRTISSITLMEVAG